MAEQTVAPEPPKTNGTIRRRDPFDLFQAFQQEVERFWPHFPFPFGATPAPTTAKGASYMPRMDVYEKDNKLVYKAELPGLKKDDVQVELDNGYLVIRGESKAEQEVNEEAFYRLERNYGSFYRAVAVPFDITPEQITATLTDGVLQVEIPKPAETTPQPKTIPVT